MQVTDNAQGPARHAQGVAKIKPLSNNQMINDDDLFDDYDENEGNPDYEEEDLPQKSYKAKKEDSFRFSEQE